MTDPECDLMLTLLLSQGHRATSAVRHDKSLLGSQDEDRWLSLSLGYDEA